MNFILEPWPWYVGGPLITLVMFFLYYFGKKFGISSSLESICAMGGAGKIHEHFNFGWKKSKWNLMFIIGTVIGGYIAFQFMTPNQAIALNPQTISDLSEIGFQNAGEQFLPEELFGLDALLSIKGGVILVIGGILVGFGARYAGGCTSGHAITGLSNLELPSLIAVIGFFIGGLVMTWLILPLLF
ncbi:YeeE/YedE thiosulfate transporter family protein [Pontimicrobium sp. SW4]|uniref:YeeE/YedE thiosulfate transporter family protein n=1 Tax=Pontimicrobium sp. SW4 TaxID=3153519 RepID=A0AAU7BP53_9FLAO